MKVATTLAAIVGTLAVLVPLSAATQPAAERDSVVAYEADLESRSTSSCGVTSRKHHHKKGKKKSKAKAKQIQAQVNSFSVSNENKKKHKASSARPAHYYSSTQKASSATSTKATSTPASASTSSTGTTLSSFEQTMLSMHNADRAKHSASPLTWDTTLASAAAKWASGCKWQHTPNNPYGQNIAAGTASNFGAKQSCTMWYDEVSQYDFSAAQYSDATGHFTQMVWKGTKRLGCAIQECTASQMGLGSSGKAQYVVCNYDPPGNVIGQFKENVLAS
ncbi:related to PRY1-strong similarity to the plant PR-1 class of pathogen related proteins [Sporisorium scitamineum]|uniref:Related to PRY1-strong similarity to the plant PR-1 class of pathogen related proteins n=1 Tax=Sporisorium scitamineum TaxID=49012 RepID=A0A0F7S2F2_9BASI|nr:related to PRY1-strong similarity to the plant PR-1 class of pathogen related proteins [Sporisorium scitamineum]CDW95956.1 hypothetical protein [Sporisorium scitamineum]